VISCVAKVLYRAPKSNRLRLKITATSCVVTMTKRA